MQIIPSSTEGMSQFFPFLATSFSYTREKKEAFELFLDFHFKVDLNLTRCHQIGILRAGQYFQHFSATADANAIHFFPYFCNLCNFAFVTLHKTLPNQKKYFHEKQESRANLLFTFPYFSPRCERKYCTKKISLGNEIILNIEMTPMGNFLNRQLCKGIHFKRLKYRLPMTEESHTSPRKILILLFILCVVHSFKFS